MIVDDPEDDPHRARANEVCSLSFPFLQSSPERSKGGDTPLFRRHTNRRRAKITQLVLMQEFAETKVCVGREVAQEMQDRGTGHAVGSPRTID
jgi:hypothetical protein